MEYKYVEIYQIGDARYGIEDYEDGQPAENHFMGNRYGTGKTGDPGRRFQVWRNGGGIKKADTIEQARYFIFEDARQRLSVDFLVLRDDLRAVELNLNLLGDDERNIEQFKENTNEEQA